MQITPLNLDSVLLLLHNIRHFRVLLCLCFKTSLSAKLSSVNSFIFYASQSHFHKKSFALRLALKQRHRGPNSKVAYLWERKSKKKRDVEHNLLKHNLGQKLNVIKDADIFSSLCSEVFLQFKATSIWNTANKSNANQESPFEVSFKITLANIQKNRLDYETQLTNRAPVAQFVNSLLQAENRVRINAALILLATFFTNHMSWPLPISSSFVS